MDNAPPPMKSSRKKKPSPARPPVLTIGHSTRTIQEFIQLLQAHGVVCVVDVRTVPRSRHNPQFNRDTLPDLLKPAGIGYRHMVKLGGFRHTQPDSPNMGWNNTSFRGFADYMQTPEFAQGLTALIKLSGQKRSAIMCAEAVPWRCHRSLIADALLIRGIQVEDIMGLGPCSLHSLTSFAKVKGTHIIYPVVKSAGDGPSSDEKAAASRSRPAMAPQQKRQRFMKKTPTKTTALPARFKVGDQVEWNSEAGRVRGTIRKKVTAATKFKTYTVRASKEVPQYLIKSDTTDHLAMHKGSALRKCGKNTSSSRTRSAHAAKK